MNSHFKKIRKENTGKIGVWGIKKMKIMRKCRGTAGNKGLLTTVKGVLRNAERRPFYPLISSLGMKYLGLWGGYETVLLISKKHSGTAQACQC